MNPQLLKGHLDLLLLATLRSGALHGYAIAVELARRSRGTFDLAEGTIYPALHRLERSGLIRSRWSEEAARRRRVYELTNRGAAALGTQRQEWQQFAKALNAVLHGVPEPWPA